jgi:hypothetical protein
VLDGALRGIAIVLSAFIALSFVLFAVENLRDASDAQRSAVIDPGAAVEQRRAEEHTAVREAIDDVNDVVLRPFAGVVSSDNEWVQRIVPGVLGLLVYGLGLAYLARLLEVRSRKLSSYRYTSTRSP